jgi:Xaa-Pro aminopeptidase
MNSSSLTNSGELSEKTARIARLLHEENLGGLLINAQHNFSWLTAGGSNGIDTSRDPGAGALLIRNDGRRFVLANRIEMHRLLAEEIPAESFEPVDFPWEDERGSATFLAETALKLLPPGTALGSDLPFGQVTRVVEPAISHCRYQLTDSEIERYQKLGSDAGQAIGDLARGLAPGETELEVARKANDALSRCGARAVVTLVAADERLQKFRHPVPTAVKWEKSLMIVVCARRGGLIASLTRIVTAGKPAPEIERRTLAAARVNAQLQNAARPGVSGAQLYELAAKAYAAEGFEGEVHKHHQGGATGYRTRDWVAHPASRDVVQKNQAFAWNPSITGTKVEETCIGTPAGVALITASPGWPAISIEVDGAEYLSPDVLQL